MTLRRIVFSDPVEGYITDAVTGDQIDASNQLVSNVADPVSVQDVATKAYVDALAQGISWKQPVRVAQVFTLGDFSYDNGVLTAGVNGALGTIDGVTLVQGDRLLVRLGYGASPPSFGLQSPYNGIYDVTDLGSPSTPCTLTRSADADTAEKIRGAAVFVQEGTVYAENSYVLIADAPIVLGTSGLQFSSFASTTPYSFDQGLIKSGNLIKVDLDASADAQGAGAGGGSSGLEFDADVASGKLRVAVKSDGGLERNASGLALRLDATAASLSTSAAGLKALSAPLIADNYIADEAISAGDPVAASSTSSRVLVARADNNAKARVLGVAATAAASAGDTIAVITHGVLPGALTGATPNANYFLGATGGLDTTVPSGCRSVRVGVALSATDLWVDIVERGARAGSGAPPVFNTWLQKSPTTSPPTLAQCAMAFDVARGKAVLVGGTATGGWGGLNTTTYLWDGTNWSAPSLATTPDAAVGMAVVYDSARSKVLVWGGFVNSITYADPATIWEWDGSSWSQITVAGTNPGGRAYPAYAYDQARGKLVIWDGQFLADTWEYDPSAQTWQQMSPTHSPSKNFANYHVPCMVYNPLISACLLMTPDNQMWKWDGSDWAQVNVTNLPITYDGKATSMTMVYDSDRQVVLVQAYDANSPYTSTWEFTTSDWVKKSPTSEPSPRTWLASCYDTVRRETVMYGGQNAGFGITIYGDTWVTSP